MRAWLAAMAACLLLAGCEAAKGPEFAIVAGSENEVLEPIVMEFCASRNAACTMEYRGSLDIGLALRSGGTPGVDAVWPAAQIWIDMFDSGRKVRHAKSISRTAVVLGVRKSKAAAFGWGEKPVPMADILAKVEARELRFLMTSATQSNSGASAYLSMLGAALGKSDLVTVADLESPQARETVRRLLSGVERTAGSSGWLGDLYLSEIRKGFIFDAMWNYEAVLKDVNAKLAAEGREQLVAIYPAEGVVMADSPLGFIDRGRGEEVEKFFLDLQSHLMAEAAQKRIALTGRRMASDSTAAAPAEPEWNFDPSRPVAIVRPPEPAAIAKALALYQETLRRPSATALCLDYSGSMEGEGVSQLRRAIEFLFTPARMEELLVQWSPRDRILLIPFSSGVIGVNAGTGEKASQEDLLQIALALQPGGGTDMYSCAREAVSRLSQMLGEEDFLPAVVLMTDGRSQGDYDGFLKIWEAQGNRIPVFGITFGAADKSQLDAVAAATGGRVFDGSGDLLGAFRSARGYN